MRIAPACCAALLVAGALSPAWAGTVYVPIVKSANGIQHSTELYVSNSSDAARNFSTLFLKADTDGTGRQGSAPQTAVTGRGSLRIASGAPADQSGLLEVTADSDLGIDARLLTAAGNDASSARLPVISSENTLGAGGIANLIGLERRPGATTDFFLVNLGFTPASCEVKLFRVDGSELIPATTLTVSSLSMRSFTDVFGTLQQVQAIDVRAQVSCNRSFYTFAAITHHDGARVSFLTPTASGRSLLTGPGSDVVVPPPDGATVLFERKGVLLVPTPGKPVFEEEIPISRALTLKRMVIELDFTVGPWAAREPDGPHAVIWLYRGEYRSNTIANVNVHGPNKNKIRGNQNVDLPGLSDRIGQQGGLYEPGKTYHFTYTYNAETNQVHVRVTEGSRVVNDFTFPGTAANRKLTIPTSGLNYVLGHRANLHYEVPSFGWTYSNLRVSVEEY